VFSLDIIFRDEKLYLWISDLGMESVFSGYHI
jgi:hypothetical protein